MTTTPPVAYRRFSTGELVFVPAPRGPATAADETADAAETADDAQ